MVYARSSDPDERLGEVLLQRGKITVRQYLEASRQIRPGRRLGAILVEMEALEADELLPSVEQHVKEILLDIFTWTTGEYAFVMTDPGVSELVTLNLSMENLILEGIRKLRAVAAHLRGRRRARRRSGSHRQHRRALQALADRRGAGGALPRQRPSHCRTDLPGVLSLQLRNVPHALGILHPRAPPEGAGNGGGGSRGGGQGSRAGDGCRGHRRTTEPDPRKDLRVPRGARGRGRGRLHGRGSQVRLGQVRDPLLRHRPLPLWSRRLRSAPGQRGRSHPGPSAGSS